MLNEELSKKIKLSNNFSLWEFLRSDDAVRYGLMALQFVVEWIEFASMQLLCIKVLEPLRSFLNESIIITSGKRSASLNTKIKGALNSHHVRCMAADFECSDLEKAFEYIMNNLKFTQVILEDDGKHRWVHVSYDPNDLRCEALKFENGKYIRVN